MEFYKRIGWSLAIFNLFSIFFMFLVVFAYSIIQYLTKPLLDITYMLFSDAATQNQLIRILDLFLVLPQFLDIAFLMIVIMFVMNLFYVAWKTENGNIYYTMMFSLIGLPLWVYLMTIIDKIKVWVVSYLGSTLSNTIPMPFYTYIQQNNLYFTIVVFMIVIAIKTIPFENFKLFKPNGDSKSNENPTFKDIIKQ